MLLSVNPVSKISLCKCPVKCRGTEGTESCQSTDHNANGLYPKVTELNITSPTHYSSLFKAQKSEAYLRYSFRYNICIWIRTSPFRTCFDRAQLYILKEINCATYKRPKKRLTKKYPLIAKGLNCKSLKVLITILYQRLQLPAFCCENHQVQFAHLSDLKWYLQGLNSQKPK